MNYIFNLFFSFYVSLFTNNNLDSNTSMMNTFFV